MATRFYLPSSGAAPVSPAVSADWEHNNAVRRATRTWRTGTSIADTSYSPDAADHIADQDAMFVQFVSDPLLPQTINAQTVKYALQGSETNARNNCSITLKVFVCSNDGSTIKETLLAIRRDGLELTTTVTNRTDSATTSSATVEEGDRLVFEFGIGGSPAAAGGVQGHNGALRFGDNQATDLAENDTDTGSTNNPWIEFAENLALIGVVSAIRQPADVVRRRAPVALIAMSLAFVPVMQAAAPAGESGGPSSPAVGTIPTIQYQDLAGPVFVPAFVPETIEADKWAPQYPSRHVYRRSQGASGAVLVWVASAPVDTGGGGPSSPAIGTVATIQYQDLAGPVFVGEAPPQETVTLDKWLPSLEVPRRPRPPIVTLPAAEVEFGVVVDVPVQSWIGHYPGRIARVARVAWFPALTSPVEAPSPPVVTPLSWRPDYPDAHRSRRFSTALQRPWQADKFTAPAEVIAPDLAAPQYPAKVYGRQPLRPHPSWTAPLHVPDVTTPVTSLSWRGVQPDAVHRVTLPTSMRQAFGWAVDTPQPVVTPELRPPVAPDRLHRKPAVAQQVTHAAPLYVPDVTVTAPSLAAWLPVTQDWIARRTFPASQQQWLAWHTETPPTIDFPTEVSLIGSYVPTIALTGSSVTTLPLTGSNG